MSEEQLKAFLEKVKADTNLQEKLKAAADTDAVVAIAKDSGFNISADDVKKTQAVELTDEELEYVVGGYSATCYNVITCGTNDGGCSTLCPTKSRCAGPFTHGHQSCSG